MFINSVSLSALPFLFILWMDFGQHKALKLFLQTGTPFHVHIIKKAVKTYRYFHNWSPFK